MTKTRVSKLLLSFGKLCLYVWDEVKVCLISNSSNSCGETLYLQIWGECGVCMHARVFCYIAAQSHTLISDHESDNCEMFLGISKRLKHSWCAGDSPEQHECLGSCYCFCEQRGARPVLAPDKSLGDSWEGRASVSTFPTTTHTHTRPFPSTLLPD